MEVSRVCRVTGKTTHVEYGLTIVKRLINLNRNKTKTFVMCSNSSSSPCGESSLHLESGRICCLYRFKIHSLDNLAESDYLSRIDDGSKYLAPEALSKLQAPQYDIHPEVFDSQPSQATCTDLIFW